MRMSPLVLLALIACKGDKDGTDNPNDDSVTTGTDSDSQVDDSGTDDSAEPCLVKPQSIVPEEEEAAWFYREPIVVTFTGAAPDASFVLFNRDTA